jgi:hypothetical protein
MNRKLALAASVSASTVLVAGAVMVGVLLSQGPEPAPTPDLASPAVETDSSSVTSVDPVVVYEDQYEFVVTGGDPVAAPVATEGTDGGAPSGPAPASAASASPAPAPAPVATVGSSTTTAAPTAATTTTTWPTGVPRDWPADQPIPPMPANCRQPQLEDNGVWNCQR